MNGFLNLLKPPGMTSSDAVVAIRRTLSGEKVGHAGTLDPEAAGVLPIMIGKAARLFEWVTEKQKEYIAEIAFGVSTDTQDAQGAVVEQYSGPYPDENAIRAALPAFVGDILQTPPAYSALKIGGRPAYELARKGEEMALAARPAHVDGIELLEMCGGDSAMLRVRCGKGVYIRTLCHDIGARLGCPAHMRFLLRTQSGPFTVENGVTLEEWLSATRRESLLTPMDVPIAHLPMARVHPAYEANIRNGAALTRFEAMDGAARSGEAVRVYCGDRFTGIARWREDALRFQAMLLE